MSFCFALRGFLSCWRAHFQMDGFYSLTTGSRGIVASRTCVSFYGETGLSVNPVRFLREFLLLNIVFLRFVFLLVFLLTNYQKYIMLFLIQFKTPRSQILQEGQLRCLKTMCKFSADTNKFLRLFCTFLFLLVFLLTNYH